MTRRRIVAMLSLGVMVALAAGLGSASPPPGAAPPAGGPEAGGECCCGPAEQTNPLIPLMLTLLRQGGPDEKKGEKKAGEAAVAKGDAARKALVEQREALVKDGVWDCCIEPGCVFCQTAADGCPCEGLVKKGNAVCPECWGGWQAGQGQVRGIDPARIPLASKETLKKLYDMKADKLKKAGGDKK